MFSQAFKAVNCNACKCKAVEWGSFASGDCEWFFLPPVVMFRFISSWHRIILASGNNQAERFKEPRGNSGGNRFGCFIISCTTCWARDSELRLGHWRRTGPFAFVYKQLRKELKVKRDVDLNCAELLLCFICCLMSDTANLLEKCI